MSRFPERIRDKVKRGLSCREGRNTEDIYFEGDLPGNVNVEKVDLAMTSNELSLGRVYRRSVVQFTIRVSFRYGAYIYHRLKPYSK